MFTIPFIAARCESLAQTTIDDSVKVVGNIDQAVEGTTVNFSCPSRLVLTGPSTTTCMENGQWEPDPRDSVMCKGISIYTYRSMIMICTMSCSQLWNTRS